MRKGVTLIELVVVVAIAAILISTASLSISKVKERRALEKAKSEISETISNYADRSFHQNEYYEIEINNQLKNLAVWEVSRKAENDNDDDYKLDKDIDSMVEKVELPVSLNYSTSPDGVINISTWIPSEPVVEINTVPILDSGLVQYCEVEVIKNKESKTMKVNLK